VSHSTQNELPSLTKTLTKWWRLLLVVAVLLVTYILSRLLVQNDVVHPFVLLLVVLVVDQIFCSDKSLDRLVVVIASLVGLLPVLGWIHQADVVSPIELIASIWFVSIGLTIFHNGVRRPNFSLVPAAFSSGLTYWWWSPVSNGMPVEVLSRILPQWDNSSHFMFFYLDLINREYLIRTPQLPGDMRMIGNEYPTGIHYVWSLFASSHRAALNAIPANAIPVFAQSVTLTLAISVGVAVIALLRIGKSTSQKFSYGLVAAGLSLGLIGYGPLSQTISNGFANLPAVVMGVFIVSSVALRPLPNKYLQWYVLLSGTFAILYNWYPIVLLLLPVLVSSAYKMIRRERWCFSLGVISMALIGGLPPVLQTFSLGISHLSVPGGITSFPKPLGIIILLVSCAFGIYLMTQRSQIVIGLSLLFPFLFNMGLAIFLRLTTGEYPYYFQKFFLIVCITTTFLLVMAVGLQLIEREDVASKTSRLNLTTSTFISLVLALALANISGYVGPDRSKFAADSLAPGVATRNEIAYRKWNYEPTIELILKTAQAVNHEQIRLKSCYTLFIPDRIGATGKAELLPWKELLGNVWFHGLTNSYTVEAYNNSYSAPQVTPFLSNEDGLVVAIDASFPKGTVCPVSTSKVTSGLKRLNPQWRTLAIQTK